MKKGQQSQTALLVIPPAVSRLELTLCLLGLGAEPRVQRVQALTQQIHTRQVWACRNDTAARLETELRQPRALAAVAIIVVRASAPPWRPTPERTVHQCKCN